MGQARNKAKTFEERKTLAIQREEALEVARIAKLSDELNPRFLAECHKAAERNGETCRPDEELIALPYARKLQLYRLAFEENRKPREGDKVVVVGDGNKYSAFGRRRSHAHVMAAAMIASMGTIIR